MSPEPFAGLVQWQNECVIYPILSTACKLVEVMEWNGRAVVRIERGSGGDTGPQASNEERRSKTTHRWHTRTFLLDLQRIVFVIHKIYDFCQYSLAYSS
jgi:endogenous inhibitor of DNA gyrase (YacG/DUF329 family)